MGKGVENTKGNTEMGVAKNEGRELRETLGGPSKTDCVGSERQVKDNSVGIMMFCTTAESPSKALLSGGHSSFTCILPMTESSLFSKDA